MTEIGVLRRPMDARRGSEALYRILGLLIVLLGVVGCASPPVAEGALDETDFERWSVHVLTWDADGDRRKTRVWIAAVEGTPYVRTARRTRWWQNIERGSRTQVLSGGQIHPVSIEGVDAPSLRARIDEAFTAKYGWLGRLVIDDERAKSDDPYLRLIRAPEDEGSPQTGS